MVNEIIRILEEHGYEGRKMTAVKGGVEKSGISVTEKGKSVGVTLYLDNYEGDAKGIAMTFIKEYEQNKDNCPISSIDEISNWEWAKERLYLELRPIVKDNCISKKFLDLEKIVRVVISSDEGNRYSTKVTVDFLNVWGVDEDEVFKLANENTMSDTTYFDMFGAMYVLTNKQKLNGAIAMTNIEILEKIAEEYNGDIAILPSSIHECLAVPYGDVDELYDMVKSINDSEVSPEDRLGYSVYVYDRENKTIDIAKGGN